MKRGTILSDRLRQFVQNLTSERKLQLSLLLASLLTYGTCLTLIVTLYLPDFSTGYNPRHQLFGDDFVNMWAGAKLVLQGHVLSLFDTGLYNEQLKLLTSNPAYNIHGFSYPPHILLFIVGLGFLNYFQALLIWSIAGLVGIILLMRSLKLSFSWYFIILTSPAVITNLMMGQNGLFTGVLLFGGLCLSQKRPVLAGILFAILTIKPQLGFLIPVVLILTRNWKCFLSASLGTIFLVGLSIALFGWDAWQAYFDEMLHFQMGFLWEKSSNILFYQFMMPGFYANSYLVPESSKPIYLLVYFMIALTAAYKICRVINADRSLHEKTLLGICLATALISPYFFNYDMTAITLALLLYMVKIYTPQQDTPYFLQGLTFLLLWSLPLTTLIMRGNYEANLTASVTYIFMLPSLIMGAAFYFLFLKKKNTPLPPVLPPA